MLHLINHRDTWKREIAQLQKGRKIAQKSQAAQIRRSRETMVMTLTAYTPEEEKRRIPDNPWLHVGQLVYRTRPMIYAAAMSMRILGLTTPSSFARFSFLFFFFPFPCLVLASCQGKYHCPGGHLRLWNEGRGLHHNNTRPWQWQGKTDTLSLLFAWNGSCVRPHRS